MKVIANGSKWHGQPEDPIERLYEVLKTHPLDPRSGGGPEGEFFFEPVYLDRSQQPPPGTYMAQGNFFTLSHGFRIEGTAEEMEPLRLAIEANTASPDYARAYQEIGGGGRHARQLAYDTAPKLYPPTATRTRPTA